MLLLLHQLIELLKPILVPVCFVIAWIFIFSLGSTLWGSVKAVSDRTQKMHQIPCTSCQFFTNDYRLKCTVQPTLANTEEAINCGDYLQKKD